VFSLLVVVLLVVRFVVSDPQRDLQTVRSLFPSPHPFLKFHPRPALTDSEESLERQKVLLLSPFHPLLDLSDSFVEVQTTDDHL